MQFINHMPYERGPFRPPSEAYSLLIRVTRGCPWNKCEFCSAYKSGKFQLRKVEEIKDDILTAARFHSQMGAVYKTAFLQDGNSIIMPIPQLLEVMRFLREKIPSIERITSYARSHTIAHRSVGDLMELKEAGLSLVYVGLETGYGELLDYVKKGCTPDQHIAAGRKIMEAGITLSENVMPGLGGKKWWRQHAIETANVLNRINPDFIRMRSMIARPGTPMHDRLERGEWQHLSDEEVVREQQLFIQNLDGIESHFVSDHMNNLLMELNGKFPEAKEDLLATIDRYLGLPPEEKLHFSVGRRLGYYERLDDLEVEEARANVDDSIQRLNRNFDGNIEEALLKCRQQMT